MTSLVFWGPSAHSLDSRSCCAEGSVTEVGLRQTDYFHDNVYNAVDMENPSWEILTSLKWMWVCAKWPSTHNPNCQTSWSLSLLSPTFTHRHMYWIILPSHKRRLNRPRHCSKGIQPMPKAVYCSGFCEKRQCWYVIDSVKNVLIVLSKIL